MFSASKPHRAARHLGMRITPRAWRASMPGIYASSRSCACQCAAQALQSRKPRVPRQGVLRQREARRVRGLAVRAALLPIAHGAEAHAHEARELGLRKPEFLSDAGHVGGLGHLDRVGLELQLATPPRLDLLQSLDDLPSRSCVCSCQFLNQLHDPLKGSLTEPSVESAADASVAGRFAEGQRASGTFAASPGHSPYSAGCSHTGMSRLPCKTRQTST